MIRSLLKRFAHYSNVSLVIQTLRSLFKRFAHYSNVSLVIQTFRSLFKHFARYSNVSLIIQTFCSLFKRSYFSYIFNSFPLFIPKSESLLLLFAHLLFFKERLEQFSPVALYKRVTPRDSLKSLMSYGSNLLFFISE